MKRVFGKKKDPGPPPPSLHDASEAMDKRVDHLDVKITALEKELKGYRDKMKSTKSPAAKKNLQKRALDVLKRKRMYEQQRDQMCNQQFNLDQARHGIESAKASVTAVGALKQANVELKKTIKQDLNIDEIEDMTDDMADLMEDFNEINDALGRNFATPEDIDEEDLEAELEMLGDELEEEDELESESVPSYLQEPSLPAQPTGLPGSKVPAAENRVDEYGLPLAHNG